MTKIEWVVNPDGTQGKTWNPLHGCTSISDGCKNCYARRMARRLQGRHGYLEAPDYFKVTLRPDRLEQPLKWRKSRRVFVVSMGDLFHKDVPFTFIDEVFGIMLMTPQHIYQLLTKRSARMLDYFQADFRRRKVWEAMRDLFFRLPGNYGCPMNYDNVVWPLPNVWLGVTAENQAMADERIPLLLQTPAVVRFVSFEPLLEPVVPVLAKRYCVDCDYTKFTNNPTGRNWQYSAVYCPKCGFVYGYRDMGEKHADIDWVIVGSETGPGARLMKTDWARSLRDQCQDAGAPYFFKQQIVGGKKVHLLDGREWREMPEATK